MEWRRLFKSHNDYCKEKSRISYASSKKTYINEGETVIRRPIGQPIQVGDVLLHRPFGEEWYKIKVTGIKNVVPMHNTVWICCTYVFVKEEDEDRWMVLC